MVYHIRQLLFLFIIFLLNIYFSSLYAKDLSQILPPLPTLRPGPVITLNEAVLLADKKNQTIEVSRLNIKMAAAKLKTTYAQIFPIIYGSLNYTLNDKKSITLGNEQTIQSTDYHKFVSGIEMRMSLVNASLWTAISVSKIEQKLAELNFEKSRQELLYMTAEVYFQAVLLQRLISIFKNQSTALKHHADAAEASYLAGVGELVDVKRAHTDLVKIREEQINVMLSLEDIRDVLSILLFKEENTFFPVKNPQNILLPEKLSNKQKKLVLQHRWDLKTAKKEILLADKQLFLNWMKFAPTLNMSMQYNYDITPLNSSVADRDEWFAGLVFSMPIFDYISYSNLQFQKVNLKQEYLVFEEIYQTAKVEFAKVERAVKRTKYLIETAKVKVELADDTLTLSQANYINGTGSALAVVDAQRTSQTAHVDLETRLLELELAKIAYFKTIGKNIFEILVVLGE